MRCSAIGQDHHAIARCNPADAVSRCALVRPMVRSALPAGDAHPGCGVRTNGLRDVSRVAFITGFSVASTRPASAYFAHLPRGAGGAARLADVLRSGHLLAQLETTALA
jgi:hypothetical protein